MKKEGVVPLSAVSWRGELFTARPKCDAWVFLCFAGLKCRGLIYNMQRKNRPKFDVTIISKIRYVLFYVHVSTSKNVFIHVNFAMDTL